MRTLKEFIERQCPLLHARLKDDPLPDDTPLVEVMDTILERLHPNEVHRMWQTTDIERFLMVVETVIVDVTQARRKDDA